MASTGTGARRGSCGAAGSAKVDARWGGRSRGGRLTSSLPGTVVDGRARGVTGAGRRSRNAMLGVRTEATIEPAPPA